MIELYLLVTMASVPKVEAFQDIQQACVSFEDQANASPHIYKETIDRHGNATITEGMCKPLKQFVVPK